MTWPGQGKTGLLRCNVRWSGRDIDALERVTYAAAFERGAVALYTHSKGRNPEWRCVRLDTALAWRPSGMESTGTGSGTGGHEFSFKHVQI